jgi:hypothetical protein
MGRDDGYQISTRQEKESYEFLLRENIGGITGPVSAGFIDIDQDNL